MHEYALKRKEVDQLPYVEAANPYYRSAAPMKLYLLSDVVKVAGNRDVTAIRLKRQEATEKRRQTLAGQKLQRRIELVTALANVGLVLRGDSELCSTYINGTSPGKEFGVEMIVNEMAFMRYLHEYTDYPTRVEQEATFLSDWYGGYYPGIWKEAAAIAKTAYTPPPSWPWLA